MPPNWNAGTSRKSNLPQGYGDARCSARATRARRREGRRWRRDCARLSRRRSRDGTCGRCGRFAPPSRRRTVRQRTRKGRWTAAASLRTSDCCRASFTLRAGLGAVGKRLPPLRHLEAQRPSRLEIRLIEDREREMRPRRHEQRVEKLGIAIECRVAGGELDFDLVLSRAGDSPGRSLCDPRLSPA